jgi:hypothetical protein
LSEITDQEIIESHFAKGKDLDPFVFPELSTLSAAFFYHFTPVARNPAAPEIVFLPTTDADRLEIVGLLASWNYLWEAAQYRKEVFEHNRSAGLHPKLAAWIDRLPAANIYLVAETKRKYDAYSPLYHLLPKPVLDRYGLPAMKRPIWPSNLASPWYDRIFQANFVDRLSRAFAEHIWPYLDSGSGLRAFGSNDPLVLLSHDLDFWLPYAVSVIEERMRSFSRVDPETPEQIRILNEAREHADDDGCIDMPRKGGVLWMGEEEAACATEEVANAADSGGQLRGIIDAVRSNRVVDGFSSRWSYAREDFERKLYSKRSKVRVSFVELRDTLPVHSPRSEYTDNLLWQDFSAILDRRERHIVVCLRNGITRLGDIASTLGYANHSPISKALTRIRKKASDFLSLL